MLIILYMPTFFEYGHCLYIFSLFLFGLLSSPLPSYYFYSLSYSMFGSSCSLFSSMPIAFVWPPLSSPLLSSPLLSFANDESVQIQNLSGI